MGANTVGEAFQIGIDILKTTVSPTTGRIVAQTGSITAETTETDNVEWWQHIGIVSLPPEAEPGRTAGQAVVLRRGNHDIAFATQDARGLKLAGQLKPGETCIYGAGRDGTAQGRILIKQDGSINFYTTEGNVEGGAGLGLFLRADGSVTITTPSGSAILVQADGEIQLFSAGGGGVTIKANGDVEVASGGKVAISGGSITMGGPTALPLAIGPHVLTALTNLQTQITQLAAGLVAVGAAAALAPGASGAAAAATAATAQVSSTAGLLAAITSQIPTRRTSAD